MNLLERCREEYIKYTLNHKNLFDLDIFLRKIIIIINEKLLDVSKLGYNNLHVYYELVSDASEVYKNHRVFLDRCYKKFDHEIKECSDIFTKMSARNWTNIDNLIKSLNVTKKDDFDRSIFIDNYIDSCFDIKLMQNKLYIRNCNTHIVESFLFELKSYYEKCGFLIKVNCSSSFTISSEYNQINHYTKRI